MSRKPHWRRTAAQHAKRVKDQVAMFRHAERIEQRRLAEKADEESDAEKKPP